MARKTALNAHLWERDPDDWYVEPEWCSKALFAAERFAEFVVDPCAGTGRIVAAARAAGYSAQGYDLRGPRGGGGLVGAEAQPYQETIRWAGWKIGRHEPHPDFYGKVSIVTNPPYRETCDIVDTALLYGHDVAVFVETRALAGKARWLAERPLAAVHILTPRPSCPPGAAIVAGVSAGGGRQDFCWLVFRQGHAGAAALQIMKRPDAGAA